MRGRLIVLEGVDGSGKTTQAELLVKRLVKDGYPVVRAREPGGTTVGEAIRKLLADARRTSLTPITELFLFMASRSQLLDEVVRPALRRGQVVLLDRYFYSTAAYQGAGGEIGVATVLSMAERARFDKPDLAVLLDIDPDTALARSARRRDRIERKGILFLKRVRRGFLAMARQDPKRFRVVRADRPVEEVHEDIYGAVERVL